MITGELKNKIDGLWDIFAAGGLVNPLEVIEQITYLMFIHDLDDVISGQKKVFCLACHIRVFFQKRLRLVKERWMAHSLNGPYFVISRQTECTL